MERTATLPLDLVSLVIHMDPNGFPAERNLQGMPHPDTQKAIRSGLFVCYNCREGDCPECIGVPCHCPCFVPEEEPPEPEYYL